MHIMQVTAELCKLDAYFHSLCRGLRSHLFDVDAYSYSELSNLSLLVSTGFFTLKSQLAAMDINEALPLHTIIQAIKTTTSEHSITYVYLKPGLRETW